MKRVFALLKNFFFSRETENSVRLNPVLRWLLPNGGTLLLVAVLIATQSVWARAPETQTATSTNTISYQGRLADVSGTPLTGNFNLEFRIYDVPTGGVSLWDEFWTGGNSVAISDGLFSVMLGSLNPTLVSAIEGHNELYLGITVGTDSEMIPRIQLGSVPFSMQAQTAQTVPDGSISSVKLSTDAVMTVNLADGSVTQDKLAPDLSLVPAGTIVMWSGDIANIPVGWALCDGTNGTPDLRGRFIVGAGGTYLVGDTGGANSVALTVSEMPVHSHTAVVSQDGGFAHTFSSADAENGSPAYARWTAVRKDPVINLGAHSHTVTIGSTGGGQAHENRPPYFALTYIMKLP